MTHDRHDLSPRRRHVMLVGALGGTVVLLAGCASGPDVESQRESVLNLTKQTVAALVDRGDLTQVSILDDATQPVSCPGGAEQYRYVVYGEWASRSGHEEIPRQLDWAMTATLGIVDDVALQHGIDWAVEGIERIALESSGPRQHRLAHEGLTLTLDYMAQDDTTVTIRIEGATAC